MSQRPTLLRGEERPAPRTFEELVILVIDGSGSMSKAHDPGSTRTKAQAVTFNLIDDQNGFLLRLKHSRNRDRQYLGLVTFDDRADIFEPRPLSDLTPADLDIDLVRKHGQSTAIGSALEAARRLATDWLAEADPRIPRFVTILLLSDGQETEGTDPVAVADAIKASVAGDTSRPQIVVATAAYGPDADEAVLEAIATTRPDGSPFYKRVSNGAELRDFFLESVTARA